MKKTPKYVPVPTKTVREKIEDRYYETKVPYPKTKDFGKMCGQCAECEHFVADDVAFKAACTAYVDDNGRLREEFKADLFAENGVTGNPKADAAYQLAWDYGHADGYLNVVSYFEELVELIK